MHAAQADEEVLEEWKALGQGVNAKAGVTYANEENRRVSGSPFSRAP